MAAGERHGVAAVGERGGIHATLQRFRRGRHEYDGAAGAWHLVLKGTEHCLQSRDGMVIALAIFASETLSVCQYCREAVCCTRDSGERTCRDKLCLMWLMVFPEPACSDCSSKS